MEEQITDKIFQQALITSAMESTQNQSKLLQFRNEIQLIRFDLLNFKSVFQEQVQQSFGQLDVKFHKVNFLLENQQQSENKLKIDIESETNYLMGQIQFQRNYYENLIKSQAKNYMRQSYSLINDVKEIKLQLNNIKQNCHIDYSDSYNQIMEFLMIFSKALKQVNCGPQQLNTELEKLLQLIRSLNQENDMLMNTFLGK